MTLRQSNRHADLVRAEFAARGLGDPKSDVIVDGHVKYARHVLTWERNGRRLQATCDAKEVVFASFADPGLPGPASAATIEALVDWLRGPQSTFS